MFAKVLLLTSFLFGQAYLPETAMIGNVSTNMPSGGGIWSFIPSGVTKMTIFVEAENTETVLFWLVPTGTQTWGYRELIGYDKNGSDGWSLTWEFGNRRLHDHIHVQALGSDHSSQANDIINVVTELN
ncbi:hypothetical protein [Paenibacillus sp. BK033]|uniref:hypothetical protein n=1 Tax=Paenibacillus sp. BK033 TaxID=2512133 RepID=UPI001FB5C450|nr:hypothetical protein [Paenibacillus sp. BK033]